MSAIEYENWVREPTPENLDKILTALGPAIYSEVQRYSGPKHLLAVKAKLLAANAIKSYKPGHGTQLRSWVVTQLQPLSRYGQQLRPIYIPEVAYRQAAMLSRLRAELSEDMGREPTEAELADETGLSVTRVKNLLAQPSASVSESSLTAYKDDQNTAVLPATVMPDSVGLAEDIVFESLSPTDQQIHKFKTGKGGKQMANKDIASMLNISPARVSQRSKVVAGKINDLITKGWV
jgi:DNA-directed RNA polymerase specialized sigma subunit